MRPLALLVIPSLALACDDGGPTLLPDLGPDQATGADVGLDLPRYEGFDPGPDGLLSDTVTVDGPAIDGSAPDQATLDASPQTDGSTTFPAVLKGTWLMGWSGGMNHYSWVRFTVGLGGGGQATILDGASLTANLPYWNCSGSTTWNLASKPDTIQLHFPTSTCTGMKSEVFTFSSIKPGGYPKGSLLQASITSQLSPGTIEGYKFPDTQCNKPMTSCADPLK